MCAKRSVTFSVGDGKKPRKSLCLELKLEVIRRIEKGERQVDICNAFSLAGSTVRTILKNKDKIEEYGRLSSPLESVRFVKNRSPIMIEMERLLGIWIEDQTRRHFPVSSLLIQEKAKSIYGSLKAKDPATSDAELFKASSGWLERFKRRANLHVTALQGDAGSSDESGARSEMHVKYEFDNGKDDKEFTLSEPKLPKSLGGNKDDFIGDQWSMAYVKYETSSDKDDDSNASQQVSSFNSEDENLTQKADDWDNLTRTETNSEKGNAASVSPKPKIQSHSLENKVSKDRPLQDKLGNHYRAKCTSRSDLAGTEENEISLFLESRMPLNNLKNDEHLDRTKYSYKKECACFSKEGFSSASTKRMEDLEETNIDEDKLFLLSLLPPLKRLSPDVKSLVKLKFQQIMHETSYGKFQPITYYNHSPPCSPYAVNMFVQNPIPEVIIHNSNPPSSKTGRPGVMSPLSH